MIYPFYRKKESVEEFYKIESETCSIQVRCRHGNNVIGVCEQFTKSKTREIYDLYDHSTLEEFQEAYAKALPVILSNNPQAPFYNLNHPQ